MAREPPVLHRERPGACPACGGAHLRFVEREDMEEAGVEEPEDYEDGAWGLVRCEDCGNLVHFEA